MVDPLWAIVLLAGILAALALAKPVWASGADGVGKSPKNLPVEWALRSARGSAGANEPAEAWIRLTGADDVGVETLRINGVERGVSMAELSSGITAEVTGDRVELALAGAGKVIEEAVFEKPRSDARPFGFLRLTGGTGIDPALQRVFEMQPAARPDDPAVLPRVMIVRGTKLSAEEMAGANLVIAEPGAEMPGVKPGARVVAADAKGWTPEVVAGGGFAWPAFVSLKDVHVTALRDAELSPEWEVIVRAGGYPWMAVRRQGEQGGLCIWLASEPATETDWVQAGGGFVAFFGEMQARALGSGGMPPYMDWIRLPKAAPVPGKLFPLDSWLGATAMALLVLASGWHIARRSGMP